MGRYNNWSDPGADGQMDTATDGQMDMSVDVSGQPGPVHGHGLLDTRFGEMLARENRPWPGGARNIAVDVDLFDALTVWCAEHGVAKRVAVNWLLREFVGEEVQ